MGKRQVKAMATEDGRWCQQLSYMVEVFPCPVAMVMSVDIGSVVGGAGYCS